MNIIDKALEIGEEYPVFPCDARKRPICEGGFKAATQDPDKIQQMFSNPSAALIGVPTGEVSGLSVIDIDIRDGKAGADWIVKNADLLGQTRKVQTMSGGWHYYYRHSEGLRNRAGIDGCVDVRAEGGYVCYVDGEHYKWLNDEDFAEFPKQIGVQSTGDNITSSYSEGITLGAFGGITDGREKYMASVVLASVAEYYRENMTFPTVQWMVDNVYPAYERKVRSRVGDLDKEGRGVQEFIKKCHSTISKARRGGFDNLEAQPTKSIEKPVIQANIEPDVQSETKSLHSRRIKLKTLNDLRMTPPPTFMVADYIIDKSFAVLFGAPATFKSFLALDWALSIAHGVDWNGRPVVQGSVVYLALEGQTGLSVRSGAWHSEHRLNDADAPFYAVTSPISMVEEGAEDIQLLAEAIKETLGGVNPALIVIDTLARSFAGKDENSSTDMGIFVRNVDLLREAFDCTLLAVHHSGKESTKGMRGSSALRGAVDSEFEIVRRAETQSIELKVRKQKDVEEVDGLWLEAREVTFTQDAFGQERNSLVIDIADGAPKKKVQTSKHRDLALNVLKRCLEMGLQEVKDDFEGVPLDVFRAILHEASVKETGKPYHPSNWSRITSDWATDEGVFVIHNKELINERF